MKRRFVMTPKKGVTDEQRGKIYRKINAIIDRTGEGKSLSFDHVMDELQIIHDGTRLFDPHHTFRKGQKGLWRSENFEKYILSVAKKIPPVQLPDHITGFDLPENMNDEKIRANLGDNHVFEASEGCAVIAGMISRQLNGEKGDLLSNGKANIFYVRGKDNVVFAVGVVSGVREWGVDADRLDDDRWLAGGRAFPRTADTLVK